MRKITIESSETMTMTKTMTRAKMPTMKAATGFASRAAREALDLDRLGKDDSLELEKPSLARFGANRRGA